MSKKNNIKPTKAIKSILSRLYIIIIIILAATGAAYYLLQLNDTLQQLYTPDSSNNTSIQPTVNNVSQSTSDVINSLHESKDSKITDFASGTRINPFN